MISTVASPTRTPAPIAHARTFHVLPPSDSVKVARYVPMVSQGSMFADQNAAPALYVWTAMGPPLSESSGRIKSQKSASAMFIGWNTGDPV